MVVLLTDSHQHIVGTPVGSFAPLFLLSVGWEIRCHGCRDVRQRRYPDLQPQAHP